MPLRLTQAVVHVVHAIHTADDPLSARRIADATGHPVNTVTGVLARLEARNLVAATWSTPDGATRPIRLYTLTPAGDTYATTRAAATP